MTFGKSRIRSGAIFLALSMTVSACGNSATEPLIVTVGALAAGLATDTDAAPDLRERLTPERVSALKQPLILVSIPRREATATMSIFASTQRVNDWRSADNSSLVLERDIIVATRGLGADLFASDPGGIQDAVLAGSGRIQREQRYLDGENREVIQRYVCDVARDGREDVDLIARNIATFKVTETCSSAAGDQPQYTNSYWISEENSQIVQSRQWINEEVGYANIQHLKR